MKRYMNCALLYSVFAMAGGVFYREFTKLNAFTGKTTLSVVHTHYFLLGMVVFLLLLLLEKNFSFTGSGTGKVLAVYHTGLNLTALMFVVRGDHPGAGLSPHLRHGRRYLGHGRHRTYSAGHQPGAAAPADPRSLPAR